MQIKLEKHLIRYFKNSISQRICFNLVTVKSFKKIKDKENQVQKNNSPLLLSLQIKRHHLNKSKTILTSKKVLNHLQKNRRVNLQKMCKKENNLQRKLIRFKVSKKI